MLSCKHLFFLAVFSLRPNPNLLTNYLTNYIEQCHSWEVNRPSASQEILHIVWNLKVHYHVLKQSPPALSWARSIHSMPPHHTFWRSILIFSHLCLGLPSGLLPTGLRTKTLYVPLLSLIHATCHAHLILVYFITWIMFGEDDNPPISVTYRLPWSAHFLGPNCGGSMFLWNVGTW